MTAQHRYNLIAIVLFYIGGTLLLGWHFWIWLLITCAILAGMLLAVCVATWICERLFK